MGTLSSELGPHVARLVPQPRVYADANVPAGVVDFMRHRLAWDVLFVIEHADLRRARDVEHYRLARQLHRTLVTLDHDYFDDRLFPPDATCGVIVLSAPDERGLAKVLERVDRLVFRVGAGTPDASDSPDPLPFEGRKIDAHLDWQPAC